MPAGGFVPRDGLYLLVRILPRSTHVRMGSLLYRWPEIVEVVR